MLLIISLYTSNFGVTTKKLTCVFSSSRARVRCTSRRSWV